MQFGKSNHSFAILVACKAFIVYTMHIGFFYYPKSIMHVFQHQCLKSNYWFSMNFVSWQLKHLPYVEEGRFYCIIMLCRRTLIVIMKFVLLFFFYSSLMSLSRAIQCQLSQFLASWEWLVFQHLVSCNWTFRLFVQNLWLHSYHTRSVSKHWCFVVCSIGRETIILVWTWMFYSLHELGSYFVLMIFAYRYFFAEVFNFFRNFFLIVFHGNILLMIAPLALRLNHRPCFLAFVYIVISSMLKSYPSVSYLFFHYFLFFSSTQISS